MAIFYGELQKTFISDLTVLSLEVLLILPFRGRQPFGPKVLAPKSKTIEALPAIHEVSLKVYLLSTC